jgi:phosphoenolpyruvate phosphomutase
MPYYRMTRAVTKTRQFRELLCSGELEFLMEAHNGMSAKIVQETGFKGVWASGLSMSAALGVRDNNEASWTQILEVCEFMADATDIPILLDGDTGYGNFNNMRRLVNKLEQRGVAAVCIEDKLFPKTNSFIGGEKQPLADADEFAGKIKAAKDGQSDSDFSVIARLEAFIAGWELDEMLKRAEAYHDAGADGLLIHSKKSSPDQILAFAEAWQNRCPLVIVPTMYYSTPVEVFEEAKISTVIWANHNMRSAIKAMQETCQQIYSERSLTSIEDEVVSVKEVFRLQNAAELAAAEELYLPQRNEATKAVIMAATRGDELRDLTTDKPKTMVEIHGIPILHRMVTQFRKELIKEVTVIRGYAKEQVHAPNVSFADNDQFETTGELFTLNVARDQIEGDVIISYGDILFRRYILSSLLDAEDDIVIAVDSEGTKRKAAEAGSQDFVTTNIPHSSSFTRGMVWLETMGSDLEPGSITGEWIGLLKASTAGSLALQSAMAELSKRDDFDQLHLYDLLNHVIKQGHKIRVLYITGHWLDVDNLQDLAKAQAFN